MENNGIRKFIKEHEEFFEHQKIARCLLVIDGTSEVFVVETELLIDNKRVYVFCYDCGMFYECRTETNTFHKYLMLIPVSEYAEYINH